MKRKYLIVFAALSVLGLVSCKKEVSAPTSKEPTKENAAEQKPSPEEFADNAKTSLDWAGVYEGTIPCASCPGINVKLELRKDGTFEYTRVYQEHEDDVFLDKGKFVWDKTGNKITLNMDENEREMYLVQEGSLLLLDTEGKIITGALAENYRLKKK